MDPRSFGHRLGAVTVSALLLCSLVPAHAQVQRPNIILIVSDDFGYGDAGVYGGGPGRGMPTPNRGPFIRSVQNIANMYCTECIIGIVQNGGTPSRLRFRPYSA
jgi:arylsulfatase